MSANRFQVGLVQMAMSTDPALNTAKAASGIAEASGRGAQVICLPEMYRTPYFCQTETHAHFALAEAVDGPSVQALAPVAKKHGVAVVVETATDNVVRTVANVRVGFKNHGGNMGSSGSVAFQFKKMGVFRLSPDGVDQDQLELALIDHGLEEMGEGTGEKGEKQLVIRCAFESFGLLQAALEERKLPVISAELEYVAQTPVELPEEQAKEVLELVDALEQDEDVQRVFHNLA